MKKKNFLLYLLLILMISSCSSKKKILYVQDIDNLSNPSIIYEDYLIKEGDILKIKIQNLTPQTSSNSSITNNNVASQTRENLIFNGFTVDNSGYIDYPEIGKIRVINLTLNQAKDLIIKMIAESQILVKPSIDLKILNWSFTILGEVNRPGKYFYDNPNLNLFEAIGMAGDLTINGKRETIKILRHNGKELMTYSFDITKKDFLSTNLFQISPRDIIIIDQNNSAVKNAGYLGNSNTFLTLLSLLMSLIFISTR